jgi:hypothetical protein
MVALLLVVEVQVVLEVEALVLLVLLVAQVVVLG